MSDVPDADPGPGQALPAGASAGAMIRRAREAAGLHVAALAVALKVPVRRLEALEAGRLDLMPDLVFTRALVSSVCRQLKIDAGPILAELPQGPLAKLSVEGSINEAFRAVPQGRLAWLTQVSRPAWIAGVVLVLASLAVYFLPELSQRYGALLTPTASPSGPVAVDPSPTASSVVSTPVAAPALVPQAAPSNTAAPATATAAPAMPVLAPAVPDQPVPALPNPPSSR
jgi:cytoskeleton protein RodZ